jgi:hypothetical protein
MEEPLDLLFPKSKVRLSSWSEESARSSFDDAAVM